MLQQVLKIPKYRVSTFLTKIRKYQRNFRPNVIVDQMSYRPNLAFNQTWFGQNGIRLNVMDPYLMIARISLARFTDITTVPL